MRFQPGGWVFYLFLLSVAVLLTAGLVTAQTVVRVEEKRLAFHGIDVFIKEDGSASVEERYFFTFFAGESEQFENDFVENTPSLFEWKKDYPFIHPYIGRETQAQKIEFLLNRTANQEPTLTMSYGYTTGLVQQVKVGSEGRSTRWKLSDVALVQFIFGGNINIKADTQVRLHFPNNAVVDTKILPQGVSAAENIVTVTNFQSNSLPIEYSLLTPIADPIDLGKILQNVMSSPFFSLVVAILAVIGLYVALNREKLSEKIEDYVIEHSEFRPQPKQDIDADLEGEVS